MYSYCTLGCLYCNYCNMAKVKVFYEEEKCHIKDLANSYEVSIARGYNLNQNLSLIDLYVTQNRFAIAKSIFFPTSKKRILVV